MGKESLKDIKLMAKGYELQESKMKKNVVFALEEFVSPLAVGIGFGFALDRGLVNVPMVIRSQFTFENFTMMRMFLSASVTSAAVIHILDALNLKKRSPCPGFSVTDQDTYGANVLGGLFLGSGMALSGSCPGTVWSQLGARPDLSRLVVLGGGFAGILCFTVLRDMVMKMQAFQLKSSSKFTTEQMAKMAVVFCTVGIGAIYAVNTFFPWQNQLAKFVHLSSSDIHAHGLTFPSNAWDPMFAGVMIGLLQIPVNLILGSGLGASSGWVFLTNHCLPGNGFPYFKACEADKKCRWQAVQGIGAIFGGYLSHHLLATASDRFITDISSGEASSAKLIANFIGGLFITFGARLGGGCTSGHGLTGMANMGLSSFITVAAMFAGGIATAMFFNL